MAWARYILCVFLQTHLATLAPAHTLLSASRTNIKKVDFFEYQQQQQQRRKCGSGMKHGFNYQRPVLKKSG
jgi:hypothetical protein